MGAEPLSKNEVALAQTQAPFVLGLQPSALVDHVARVDWSLLDQIPGEHGGSIPVLSPYHYFSSFLLYFYSPLFLFFIITRWVLTSYNLSCLFNFHFFAIDTFIFLSIAVTFNFLV